MPYPQLLLLPCLMGLLDDIRAHRFGIAFC